MKDITENGVVYTVSDSYPEKPYKKIVKSAIIDNLQSAFLHCVMAGGDGMIPVGIVNNGTDVVQFTATLRESEDPNSSVVQYSKIWRTAIRDTDGRVYDLIKISMVDGVVVLDYHTDNSPAICSLDPEDLEETFQVDGNEYAIKVMGNTEFKVYRDFT